MSPIKLKKKFFFANIIFKLKVKLKKNVFLQLQICIKYMYCFSHQNSIIFLYFQTIF